MNGHISSNDPNINKDYQTDEMGNIFFNVNVLGHVKKPGNFKVYEGSDFLSVLSMAGGPLPGSNLKNVIIFKTDSEKQLINLSAALDKGQNLEVILNPNDTIYIKQTLASYFLSKVNILNSFLQILNLYITISK